MAIGVSPCPPFVKCPAVPGVIYDGNTVAWFKHNDSNTVIKDGANRVSFWLDRYNYAVGPELIDQAAWFTPAYWDNVFQANWSQVGNTLVSDGNNGAISRLNFWIVGRTYKITISIIRNGGDLYPPYGVGAPSGLLSATGTYTYYYTTANVNINCLSVLFDGVITALSIKEITGRHLIQATGANQPLWSAANGLKFDGGNDFMKAITFAYIQPEMIYFVARQITWTINDCIFDGQLANSGVLYDSVVTPQIAIFNGGAGLNNLNFILNAFAIVRTLLNGANSTIQVNNTAVVAGVLGAGAMNGYELGSQGVGASCSDIEVKEIILRRTVDNAATQTAIYNYLRNSNAIP